VLDQADAVLEQAQQVHALDDAVQREGRVCAHERRVSASCRSGLPKTDTVLAVHACMLYILIARPRGLDALTALPRWLKRSISDMQVGVFLWRAARNAVVQVRHRSHADWLMCDASAMQGWRHGLGNA